MNHKEAFSNYIREASADGSNRASSYIRAIDLLDSILSHKAADAFDSESIWTIFSAEHVQRLYQLVLEQQRLGQDGLFAGEEPVSYFWKMILHQYENRCCVTGLDLPDLCIASHIIRWTDNTKIRMDPRNGLCLSATYDKAFENHLITFDEYYRLVVSKEIRDHYRNEHARELFEKREGQVILMPKNADKWPLQKYLESHRKNLSHEDTKSNNRFPKFYFL